MTKAKLTRIPKRVLACVLAVLMVLSCLTMLPFTGFAANENHAKLESPAVVQDGSKYYAFGSGNVLYSSDDMADWDKADPYISVEGVQDIVTTYEGRLDETITEADLSSPEVVEINGIWYLYISAMSGSTSMILRAASDSESAAGPYTAFDPIMETGFARKTATDVLQGYIQDAYNNSGTQMPVLVSEWGKGTCYYYSNFLGLNYQWFTEQLPRAYAPSIAQDAEGNYWMAYGYRDGGIWMQKIDPETGLVDYTWSGNNYAALGGWQTSPYQYVPEEDYNTSSVGEARLDPYFGELLVHTTEGGDTDTLLSSVSRAGEEPELYFADGTAYLQVTYGGPNNSDGYNVRSYKNDGAYHPNGTTDTWNFVDMKGESGVNNADAGMITDESDRTGLKLMGDYNMPGTASATYYTSPGASSVSTGENGLTFYNYQVKFNNATNGNPASDTGTEMRSHILLHNVNGDPLVTPFEYTGSASEYNAAVGSRYDTVEDIVGQYYVVASGTETSTSKASYGGITLTADGSASGLISGTWEFENGNGYNNYVVIHDEVNNVDYHGAFLVQEVEDANSLGSTNDGNTTMTFTLVGNNQTVWGAWYDNYEPSGENNAADSDLSVSSAIYTGGALALDKTISGQLGLKWGNYITGMKFANLDYSTYLTISDKYTITDVFDDEDAQSDFIDALPVTSSENDINAIINAVYSNRAVDPEEAAHSNDNADTQDNVNSANTDPDSISRLRLMITQKAAEAAENNQHVYILTGYLDSTRFGRSAVKDNDKGDIVLRVTYQNADGQSYTERVYTHVYQQPVPANLSGSVYFDSTAKAQNSVFLRAEGSYAADSTFSNGTIRNSNMSDPNHNKYFAAIPTFGYYNDSLFTDSPEYGVSYAGGLTQKFFHEHYTTILDGGQFNEDYRNRSSQTDIAVSYEQTDPGIEGDGNDSGVYRLVAGPRAEYYIDLSSPETSNIAGYIDENQHVKIPLYYSSIYNNGWNNEALTFDYPTEYYRAGLYPAASYGVSTSSPLGQARSSAYQAADPSVYPFSADFSAVEYMYDGGDNGGGDKLRYEDFSYSANIWIEADWEYLRNLTSQNFSTGSNKENDYNFYVRTKSEHVDDVWWGIGQYQNRMVQDMEYGIYVTDKTYLRDYYNDVMENKIAQNYTYYSWEEFRDATRLISDYLNNYMELADTYSDPTGGDDAYTYADYEQQVAAGTFPEAVERYGGLYNVLTDSDSLARLLSEYSSHVQDLFCYLLTAAEEQLFDYGTFQEYKEAYEEYLAVNESYDDYTVSSWALYTDLAGQTIEGTNITFENLYNYDVSNDDTHVDPDTEIYNPTNGNTTGLNTSWKIIYDNYVGGDAKQVFEKAIAQIREATGVLRSKANYTNLDNAMEDASAFKTGRLTLNGTDDQSQYMEDAGITGTGQDANIFSIDRSTVAALAASEKVNQGTDYVTTNEDGEKTQYTVSSVAALDKILAQVYDVTSVGNPHLKGTYETGVATDDARSNLTEEQYYSDLVRDDQQRYADADSGNPNAGEDQSTYSTVQTDIEYQARLVNAVLNQMQTLADPSEYETFDYLIDVISTIDFNAYAPVGQELLWNKLSELLVEGGVYSVNQQIFAEDADESTSELEQALFDGDNHYYTGLNAGDVDTATTELMTLLTELDETQRKTYKVNFTVQYMNTDGTESDIVSESYTKSYNTPLDLSIEGYDPNSMYAYSWVVKTYTDDGNNTETVSNLRNIGSTYTYNSNNNADITVYVTRGMADPSTDNDVNIVPVVVTTRLNQRNEVAMNLSEADLGDYSVNVNGDTLSVYNTPDASGEPFAVVTANQLPYHTFNGWRINYKVLVDGTYTLAQLYDAEDRYITISNSYTLEDFTNLVTVNGKDYAGDSAANGYVQFDGYVAIDTATYGADMPGYFYAWLITGTGADTELKIAAYTEKYSCNVPNGGYDFVQVNSDEVDGETVYYIYDAEQGYRQLLSDSQLVDKGNIQELDTNSLYYRLDNHLRDSWSSISEYDATSSKVSLYSHFTAAEDVPEAATVVESGCVAMYVRTGTDAAELNESLQIKGEGVNKFVASSFTSVTSEGQYMMSISFPSAVADTGYAVAMRSFVTYSYMGVNEKDEYGQIYRTVYSDVKLADLTTTAE